MPLPPPPRTTPRRARAPAARQRAGAAAPPVVENGEADAHAAPAADFFHSAAPAAGSQSAALPPVPSTLLIPLAARARGDRYFPWLACRDAVAESVLQRLDASVEPYLDDLPTVLNVLWRTQLLRSAAGRFFAAHPQGFGANLGCGLSHHFQWLDTGANQWLDADLPPVAHLRQRLLPPCGPRTALATVDIAQPGWWRRLPLPQRSAAQPVFVLCEGVLMYLEPVQAHAVLHEFAERAPAGSRLMLDVLTHRAVGHACRHASVGRTGAQFRWGVADLAELASAHPRLALHEAHSAAAHCYGWAGLALEGLWWPWLGAPLYAMAMVGVEDA